MIRDAEVTVVAQNIEVVSMKVASPFETARLPFTLGGLAGSAIMTALPNLTFGRDLGVELEVQISLQFDSASEKLDIVDFLRALGSPVERRA